MQPWTKPQSWRMPIAFAWRSQVYAGPTMTKIKMPMIATTMQASISVNPLRISYSFRSGTKAEQCAARDAPRQLGWSSTRQTGAPLSYALGSLARSIRSRTHFAPPRRSSFSRCAGVMRRLTVTVSSPCFTGGRPWPLPGPPRLATTNTPTGKTQRVLSYFLAQRNRINRITVLMCHSSTTGAVPFKTEITTNICDSKIQWPCN